MSRFCKFGKLHVTKGKRSNKVSTWSKNGITEHKGYDKKVLSMYENVFFEMLERIIQLENEKE